PSYLTPNRVVAGLHGRKTGRGWYAYGPDAPAPADEPPVTGDPDRPVFVAGGDTAYADALAASGAAVEAGAEPSDRAVVLVPVWGTTVASAVAALGLPAERTLGVDPLPAA
ncbi:MAG TPA: 3-hydroxyacyl-CoA dehydrogenase, partial [Streptomyces sp.]|nr:3-hydroxyacyl-CoA dehydrogenase [Streptomyces sp.]